MTSDRALLEEIRDRVVRVETAIAGDPILGVPGLNDRVYALEREGGGKKLHRAMVAIGTFLGAMVGAAASPFAPK